MNKISPSKLKIGDKVMVIAPSNSIRKKSLVRTLAQDRLEEELGLKIVYSESCLDLDTFALNSIELRLKDLHNAFKDKNIKAIICATGGYSTNDLLPHIDWKILKDNPKPFIGSSDITVLLNSIYAKTGMTTYFGPNFYKFGMKVGIEYTLDYLEKCITKEKPYLITPSEKWSDDAWYKDQVNRNFYQNKGYTVYHHGSCEGTIIGGNLCSLNLLQGTEFMPNLKGAILFLEDDDLAGESSYEEFKRNLQSLLQLPMAKFIKGIVIGRFLKKSLMTNEKMKYILSSPEIPNHIPIIAELDFGHSDPICTFPIGGTAKITTENNNAMVEIISH